MNQMRALLLLVLALHPDLAGVSHPAEPITAARIAGLPADQRKPWLDYLARSEAQLRMDHAALAAERGRLTGPVPATPKEGFGTRSMPADRDAAFYRTPEARRIADTVLSFQIPNGGWSKNLDMTQPARQPGEGLYAEQHLALSGRG